MLQLTVIGLPIKRPASCFFSSAVRHTACRLISTRPPRSHRLGSRHCRSSALHMQVRAGGGSSDLVTVGAVTLLQLPRRGWIYARASTKRDPALGSKGLHACILYCFTCRAAFLPPSLVVSLAGGSSDELGAAHASAERCYQVDEGRTSQHFERRRPMINGKRWPWHHIGLYGC